MTAKPRIARACEIIQTGTVAGLAAIPFVADAGRYKATPQLQFAVLVLAPLAFFASFWISRTTSPTRGFWGAILAIAFTLWALSTPVVL